ncbi:hypothetical protein ED733_008272 [Metarhizium rileyi]|uniref:Uncharacterized protein n=1 Tax=Metarhizium rileyi (strain RCEF 4871) TaxID=1649241 RepID=A0A5C6GHQ5_METRR|nr:hypothetical protein ED733_008272 [Metarhizium rileyi]
MNQPLEWEGGDQTTFEEENLIQSDSLMTDVPPLQTQSEAPLDGHFKAEPPLRPEPNPTNLAQTSESIKDTEVIKLLDIDQHKLSTPDGDKRDEPLGFTRMKEIDGSLSADQRELSTLTVNERADPDQHGLSTPTGKQRSDSLFQDEPKTECLSDELKKDEWMRMWSEQMTEMIRNSCQEVMNHTQKELTDLIQGLCSENSNLRLQNESARRSLRTAQEQAQKAAKSHENTGARANEDKIPDSEFLSKWTQLKFRVRMLSAHIKRKDPDDSLPAWHRAQVMTTFQRGKENMSDTRLFQGSDNRRFGLQANLWKFLSKVIFDSKSRTDGIGSRHILKKFRKECASLKTQDTTETKEFYKWLQLGWSFTKPSRPGSVDEILRKDGEDVCKLFDGNDGMECSDSLVELCDEFRDIVAMALELDDMIMASQALMTVVWPVDLPELNIDGCTEYRESHMEAVRTYGDDSENVRLGFCITPILLKKGNARGKSYNSEIVLARGDVVLFPVNLGNTGLKIDSQGSATE